MLTKMRGPLLHEAFQHRIEAITGIPCRVEVIRESSQDLTWVIVQTEGETYRIPVLIDEPALLVMDKVAQFFDSIWPKKLWAKSIRASLDETGDYA